MGTVCHRMGSFLPPPGGNPMFAQICINDPDSAARVASRIRMTDGLSADTALTPNSSYTYAESLLSAVDQLWTQLERNVHDAKKKNTRKMKKDIKRIVTNTSLKTRKTSETKKKVEAKERKRTPKRKETKRRSKIRMLMCTRDLSIRKSTVNFVFMLAMERTQGHTTRQRFRGSSAAVIIDANAAQPRDIVLYTRRGGFNRIYETNPHYDPLQYPLLHPYGEFGWTYKLPYTSEQNSNNDGDDEGRTIMAKMTKTWKKNWLSGDTLCNTRMTNDRIGDHSLLLLGGRLTQQYCVDQWSKAEQQRLRYIENNQLEFRLEAIQGLTDEYRHEGSEAHRVAAMYELEQTAQDSVTGQERQQNTSNVTIEPDTNDVGRRLILPPSLPVDRATCTKAIVRELDDPNLFITYTCNPKWVEIKENLRPGQTAADRSDIVARVFLQKLKAISNDLDEGVLEIQVTRIHVVEYQKRGLPHAHILLISRPEDRPLTAENVNRLVSAELPDKEKHPQLYEIVVTCMLHGRCGDATPNCPCMKNGKCSKKFPKPLSEETMMAEGKYPNYKRCMRPPGELMIGRKVENNATVNQWVVSYNQFLSQKYNCHINVEVCATTKAVTYIYIYIYKYVYKRAVMTMVTIQGQTYGQSLNEILQYFLTRYISPVEACMRLFKHPSQGSTHKVKKLAIHLPGQSSATYRANASNAQIRRLIRRGDQTTLTSFFMLCLAEPEVAGKMLYKNIPGGVDVHDQLRMQRYSVQLAYKSRKYRQRRRNPTPLNTIRPY
ncbi:Helitron helicase [Phytophthora megakarya]|uniref:Helitron helicase n=1 Tax=Phytophthora megakarya TaxID=4795 RepID=A0A225VVL3_9STRA|nr:Helitron helicase [Phytophthora megakarya]